MSNDHSGNRGDRKILSRCLAVREVQVGELHGGRIAPSISLRRVHAGRRLVLLVYAGEEHAEEPSMASVVVAPVSRAEHGRVHEVDHVCRGRPVGIP